MASISILPSSGFLDRSVLLSVRKVIVVEDPPGLIHKSSSDLNTLSSDNKS